MLFFAIALQAAPVAAPEVVTQSMAPVAVVKPKLICEDEEAVGSRLSSKRVCLTKEQWMQRRQDDQDHLQQRQTVVHVETAG